MKRDFCTQGVLRTEVSKGVFPLTRNLTLTRNRILFVKRREIHRDLEKDLITCCLQIAWNRGQVATCEGWKNLSQSVVNESSLVDVNMYELKWISILGVRPASPT